MSATTSLLQKRAPLCQTQTLRDLFQSLPAATLDKLYAHPATCLAIFRDLPELSKHYVMRLLFVETAVPKDLVGSWTNRQNQSDHILAIEALTSLNIWCDSPHSGGLPGWVIRDVFRQNLKTALLGGGTRWEVQATSDKDKYAKDIAALDAYSTKRWEIVLHYMVGSTAVADPKETVSGETMDTLRHAGLIEKETDKIDITADGFQFLLMDTNAQVWFFMLKYLEKVEEKGLQFIDCMTFLFQLCFTTLGQVYSTDNLSKSSLAFLQNLRDFGLIYQRKRKDSKFYPTRLAINLITGLRNSKIDTTKPGFAIVETNYRVYAYTDSPLQIALLALFVEMHYRFPGFCLGILTRESVREALKGGITAEQIINFLNINAHPSITNKNNPVPPTIMDQIKLWEVERDRFIYKDGVLYSQFLSQGDFELLRNYAKDNNNLIWENPSKRVMVVTDEGHENVRSFWKRHKKDSKKK